MQHIREGEGNDTSRNELEVKTPDMTRGRMQGRMQSLGAAPPQHHLARSGSIPHVRKGHGAHRFF